MRFTNGRHTIYMSKESKDKQFVTEITRKRKISRAGISMSSKSGPDGLFSSQRLYRL